jgi:hypothetical protein
MPVASVPSEKTPWKKLMPVTWTNFWQLAELAYTLTRSAQSTA